MKKSRWDLCRLLRVALNLILVCALFAAFPCRATADDISDTLEQALGAYKDGKLKEAMKLLSSGIVGIQQQLTRRLAGFLPGELDGWVRTEPETSEFPSQPGGLVVFGNLFSSSVTYSRTDGEGEMNVTLTNQPELTGIARASLQMLENPFFKEMAREDLEETGEQVESYALEGLDGMKRWKEGDGEGEITLFIGEVLLQAEGRGLNDVAELEALLKTSDLEGLQRFASSGV